MSEAATQEAPPPGVAAVAEQTSVWSQTLSKMPVDSLREQLGQFDCTCGDHLLHLARIKTCGSV